MSDKRKHFRRIANDYYLIYDRHSEMLIGRILNMSPDGALIITDKPLPVPEIIACRMEFPEVYKGINEISFDAECRWCRYNDKTELYEIGLEISYNNTKDKSLINDLIYSWMVDQSESLNSRQRDKTVDCRAS